MFPPRNLQPNNHIQEHTNTFNPISKISHPLNPTSQSIPKQKISKKDPILTHQDEVERAYLQSKRKIAGEAIDFSERRKITFTADAQFRDFDFGTKLVALFFNEYLIFKKII